MIYFKLNNFNLISDSIEAVSKIEIEEVETKLSEISIKVNALNRKIL